MEEEKKKMKGGSIKVRRKDGGGVTFISSPLFPFFSHEAPPPLPLSMIRGKGDDDGRLTFPPLLMLLSP